MIEQVYINYRQVYIRTDRLCILLDESNWKPQMYFIWNMWHCGSIYRCDKCYQVLRKCYHDTEIIVDIKTTKDTDF